MKKPIKATYKQSTYWLEQVVQSFILATCIHFVLSCYHTAQDGFESAYAQVSQQTMAEERIVFSFHTDTSIEILSAIILVKTWIETQVGHLWENSQKNISSAATHLNFSDKKNPWNASKNTTTSWWQKGCLLVKNLFVLFVENIKVVFYKTIVFVYALPLLAVSSLIGCIDGLIQREIRTQEMGRESSYLFHKFSTLSSKLIKTLMMLYFILPLSLSITWFLMPMAGLTCFLSAQTCRHLKKYL